MESKGRSVATRSPTISVICVLKATTPKNAKDSVELTATAIDQIQTSLRTVAQSANQVRAHEEMLREAGVRLDRAGAALLYKLRVHSDSAFRVTSLATLLGVDTPTVTRKVQQLERLGYVTRSPDSQDRRATRISLTTAGEETLDRILAAHRERLGRVLARWSDDDVRTFATLLEMYATSIQEERDRSSDH